MKNVSVISCLFISICFLIIISPVLAVNKYPMLKPRTVTSMHEAFIGHWKMQGVHGNWKDYYVTDTTTALRDKKIGNVLEGNYTVSSETPVDRTMLYEETDSVPGLDLPSVTDQNMITFSKDFRSATLIWNVNGKYDDNGNYHGPDKHHIKYVGDQ
ncbi:MAG: hypothetical protein NT099_06840 [Candidatus Saganbacteria bacterium]|nr:hypothetical protein [Candidatus Saganbacteria bacterium]